MSLSLIALMTFFNLSTFALYLHNSFDGLFFAPIGLDEQDFENEIDFEFTSLFDYEIQIYEDDDEFDDIFLLIDEVVEEEISYNNHSNISITDLLYSFLTSPEKVDLFFADDTDFNNLVLLDLIHEYLLRYPDSQRNILERVVENMERVSTYTLSRYYLDKESLLHIFDFILEHADKHQQQEYSDAIWIEYQVLPGENYNEKLVLFRVSPDAHMWRATWHYQDGTQWSCEDTRCARSWKYLKTWKTHEIVMYIDRSDIYGEEGMERKVLYVDL